MKSKHKNSIDNKEIIEIMPKTLTTYLGTKGYTLLKNELTVTQQQFIRSELTVRPFTYGTPLSNTSTFPAYRESTNKFYVPRFFGIHHFGDAKEVKISEGDDIDIEFSGVLRDYQAPVVEKYLNYVYEKGGGLLELYCAWGKTSASLYILSKIKKKTLVIVHKEFLMNQWIDRIQQFLPTARIGKIQGQIIDIENKDIVLVMLQSLSMKEYPPCLFNSFGFTIIDEVHHISAETFSCALFKFVTKYSLGLSATMNSKDGTTKTFKMFLGEVVHKTEKKEENEVEVRSITYKTNDDDFNETILDYKGQPQISSMISQLCMYNRRTEFIIKVLVDFICVEGVDKEIIDKHKLLMDSEVPFCKICNKNDNYLIKNTCCNTVNFCLPCINKVVENAKTPEIVINKMGTEKYSKKRPKCPCCKKVLLYEQNYIKNQYVKPLHQTQTIIMSHNLNVLEYIYNKFVCKNLASVGFYVGGMTESQLKMTESKQVILASYSMCSEGLDIPTLTTEFLITPKTDVVQIVGRILRAKHLTTHPIIYDFVDTHDVFQRQWLKRKSYYKKQNYKIIGCNSYDYTVDFNQWKIIFCENYKYSNTKNVLNDEDSVGVEDNDNEQNTDGKNSVGKCLLTFRK